MKKLNVNNLYMAIAAALAIAGCSAGDSSSSSSAASEQGVAVFMPDTSIAESPSYVSTAPSTGVWNSYISGTTSSIKAVAANTNNILAYNGTDFIVSNAQGAQFTKINFGVNLESATLVAGESQFVMYTPRRLWTITPSTNTVVEDTLTGLATTITSVVSLENIFYAYTGESTVYSSTNGTSWNKVTDAVNIQPFTNVIQLNTGLYAAMTAPQLNTSNPNLWLGVSPTSFNPESQALQNFFGVPAQVNFIGTTGNNNLYINETISFTQLTIRLYNITNASQQTTGSIIQTESLPASISGAQKPTGIYFANNAIYLTSGTVESQSNPSGNLINPTGPTSLTALPVVYAAAITSQFVGSPSVTKGNVYTSQNNTNFIVAPGTESSNFGALTMITSASNVGAPSYDILPTGESVVYQGVLGNVSQYMLLLNNGGLLLNNGTSYLPITAISNTGNESASVALTDILSAGTVNSTYLVQATSNSDDSNGDLYYSSNGTTWVTIPQQSITSANLGTLAENAVTVNKFNNTFNITTSTGTYQTTNPSLLTTWVLTLSPTPLFYINGSIYTLYQNTTNVGTFNGSSYTITPYAIPQNYVQSGNVAYNGTDTVALAQDATIVESASAATGSNYIWTSSSLTGSWTLNYATFYNLSKQLLETEYFNVNPVLIWTGKTWITEGNGNVLNNFAELPGSIYSSSNVTTWNAESYANGMITGIPVAF